LATRRRGKVKNGFTLIEVSIVIFIILMMTSAVVPWMKTFAESTRLRSTARSIRSLMEFARSCAITERTEYVVLFDVSNGEYWLSLEELLNETSGGNVTDESRTSLSESLSALSEQSSSDTSTSEETEQTASRTGGILGIPKTLPTGIEIIQIVSPRSSSGNNDIEYVVFHPDSTAEDLEVYLQSPRGKVLLLSVTEATGRTGIRELNAEEKEELGLISER